MRGSLKTVSLVRNTVFEWAEDYTLQWLADTINLMNCKRMFSYSIFVNFPSSARLMGHDCPASYKLWQRNVFQQDLFQLITYLFKLTAKLVFMPRPVETVVRSVWRLGEVNNAAESWELCWRWCLPSSLQFNTKSDTMERNPWLMAINWSSVTKCCGQKTKCFVNSHYECSLRGGE